MKGGDRAVFPENGNTAIDSKIWETFRKSFAQVQTILDQNRVLISEINQNHESKMPENLARNVVLIRELNTNIARVVELYANLSTEFIQSMDEGGEMVGVGKDQTAKADASAANGIPVGNNKKPRHG